MPKKKNIFIASLLSFFLVTLFETKSYCQKNTSPVVYSLGSFSLNSNTEWLKNVYDSEISDSVSLIGLGEFTHGGHETALYKAKMIQYLVEKKNFRTLFFEYPNSALSLLNYFLTEIRYKSLDTLDHVAMGAFNGSIFDKSQLELFQWIKKYNLSHPDDVISLKGIDILGATGSFANYFMHNFSSLLDPKTKKTIDDNWDQRPIDSTVTHLIKWIYKNSDSIKLKLKTNYADFIYNVNNAELQLTHLELQQKNIFRASFFRDSVMYQNIKYLNNGRAIIWAHNSHISYEDNMVSFGNMLRQYYRGKYYTILTDFSTSAVFWASIKNGKNIEEKKIKPSKLTLASILKSKFLIPEGMVMYSSIPPSHKFPSTFSSVNKYGDYQILGKKKAFDALVIFSTVTPAKFK